MKLKSGSDLTPKQAEDVKKVFRYRLTFENESHIKEVYNRNGWDFSVVKLHSDSDWLANTSFWFTDGGKLAQRRHCYTYYGIKADG